MIDAAQTMGAEIMVNEVGTTHISDNYAHAVVELTLFAINTSELYDEKKKIIALQTERMNQPGAPAKVEFCENFMYLWVNWLETARARYRKEVGSEDGVSFNKTCILKAARYMTEIEYDSIQSGDYR